MNQNHTSTFGPLAVGIFVGGLIGAGLALLSAPMTGEQTRTRIRSKGYELKDRANTTVQETRTRAGTAMAKVRTQAEGLVSNITNRTKEEYQPDVQMLDI